MRAITSSIQLMTHFLTKLASAVSAIALIATLAPAAAFAAPADGADPLPPSSAVFPTDSQSLTSAQLTKIDWADAADAVSYTYEVSTDAADSGDGDFSNPLYTQSGIAVSELATSGNAAGTYYWHIKTTDDEGRTSAWSETFQFTVVAPVTPGADGKWYVDSSNAGGDEDGTAAKPFDTIEDAIAVAANGDTILVTGTFSVASTIAVNKDVTIDGQGSATINTSGSNYVMLVTGAGATVTGFTFNTATDSGNQNMIGIQANDVTIDDNTFTGMYVIGDGEVTRALEVSGHSGIAITNNTFSKLRQPAYVNAGASGSITGNSVSGTKGWVIESGSTFAISGNTWGSGADTNTVDIAVIAVGGNNYSDVVALGAANNDAQIINKAFTPALLNRTYVSATAVGNPNYDQGAAGNPFLTIDEAVAQTAVGGVINLMSDVVLSSTATLNKAVTLNGNDRVITVTNAITGTGLLITGSNVTVNDLTLDASGKLGKGSGPTGGIQGIQAYVASDVVLNDVTVLNAGKSGIIANGSTVTVNNVTTSGSHWHGINVDQGSGVTSPAVLTVTGDSTHTEAGPDIYIDSIARGSVNDVENQYSVAIDSVNPNARAYYLKNPPTITLIGDATVTIEEGSTFTDPGATATDPEDGDLTAQIIVTGSVDTNDSGTYVLTYSVTDSAGDSAQVTRTVEVEDNNRGGSGRSGSSRRTVNTNSNVNANASVTGQVNSVTPGQGQVLGASTYNFTVDLWYGKTGADVNALQQMLIDAGLLAIPAPTGWFGPMTQAALKQWQATHGVPSTGYFGPLTRAAIAATMTAPTTGTTTPAN